MTTPSIDRELPDPLAMIAKHPDAAVPVASLPKILGLNPFEAHALVRQLIEDGTLLSWPDHPGGPCVILSTDAAAVLGLELVAINSSTFRWASPTSPTAKRAERKGRRGVAHLESEVKGGFSGVADPTPTPEDPEEPTPGRRMSRAVRPTLIYGLSQIWPVSARSDGRCRGNHPDEMPTFAYCCFCHVSGSDAALPEVPAEERPRPTQPEPHDPDQRNKLKGGRGRSRKQAS